MNMSRLHKIQTLNEAGYLAFEERPAVCREYAVLP